MKKTEQTPTTLIKLSSMLVLHIKNKEKQFDYGKRYC